MVEFDLLRALQASYPRTPQGPKVPKTEMNIFPLIVAGAFFFGADAPEDDEEAEPVERAYTLDDEWDQQWLNILDRAALPDRDGAMLQRFDGRLYRRYHFDINVPDFPMSSEAMWANQRHGARMWVQSLSELNLANRTQLRTELPVWENGSIHLQYDGLQDRTTDRSLLRFDIEQRDIADSGVDARLRFHPKWEKDDIDVEALARYSVDGVGLFGLRAALVDPFINAAFGLIEARDHVLEEHIRHRDVPLAFGADVQTESFAGVRGELYGGVVVPQTRRHRFPDAPERDHIRRRQALMGAALVEWDIPVAPVATGVAMRAVDAQMDWEFQRDADSDQTVRERTVSSRLYAVGQPLDTLRIELSKVHTSRPEDWSGPGVADATRRDREWLMWIRSFWTPSDTLGADLQLLRMHRDAQGPPPHDLDGRFNRLVTRAMLRLGDHVWTSFGIRWTLEDRTAVYDGGGMTLIYAPGEY